MPRARDKTKAIRMTGFMSIPYIVGRIRYLLREPIVDSTRSLRSLYSLRKAKSPIEETAIAPLPDDPARWKAASASDRVIYPTALKLAGRIREAAEVWSQGKESELNKAEKRILIGEPDEEPGSFRRFG